MSLKNSGADQSPNSVKSTLQNCDMGGIRAFCKASEKGKGLLIHIQIVPTNIIYFLKLRSGLQTYVLFADALSHSTESFTYNGEKLECYKSVLKLIKQHSEQCLAYHRNLNFISQALKALLDHLHR